MNYAERIRALREDSDKTQAEIAALLKVGQRTYCDYELGKTRTPVDSLIFLARFYNFSMDYICRLSDIKGRFPPQVTESQFFSKLGVDFWIDIRYNSYQLHQAH